MQSSGSLAATPALRVHRFRGCYGDIEQIPSSRQRLQQPLTVFAEGAANIANGLCERIVADDGTGPDGLHELVFGHQPASVGQQHAQNPERLWPERDVIASAAQHAAIGIEHVVAKRNAWRDGCGVVRLFIHTSHKALKSGPLWPISENFRRFFGIVPRSIRHRRGSD